MHCVKRKPKSLLHFFADQQPKPTNHTLSPYTELIPTLEFLTILQQWSVNSNVFFILSWRQHIWSYIEITFTTLFACFLFIIFGWILSTWKFWTQEEIYNDFSLLLGFKLFTFPLLNAYWVKVVFILVS